MISHLGIVSYAAGIVIVSRIVSYQPKYGKKNYEFVQLYVTLQTPFTFPAAEVTIGFVDDAIVASEPINFTVSVVLFQNILDPGTEISLSLTGRDGVATGIHITTLYYHAPSLVPRPLPVCTQIIISM